MCFRAWILCVVFGLPHTLQSVLYAPTCGHTNRSSGSVVQGCQRDPCIFPQACRIITQSLCCFTDPPHTDTVHTPKHTHTQQIKAAPRSAHRFMQGAHWPTHSADRWHMLHTCLQGFPLAIMASIPACCVFMFIRKKVPSSETCLQL